MYIEAVPNRDSPPAILLRESYREAGKVKKRTLLNLSDWPHERIAGFKVLLKGGTVVGPGCHYYHPLVAAWSCRRGARHSAQDRPRSVARPGRQPLPRPHPGPGG